MTKVAVRTKDKIHTLALLGKTGHWHGLNLERVRNCTEVRIYNWEGNIRLVAAIIPQECYSITDKGQTRIVIGFDPKTVCIEAVDPPRKFSQRSAFYEDN